MNQNKVNGSATSRSISHSDINIKTTLFFQFGVHNEYSTYIILLDLQLLLV